MTTIIRTILIGGVSGFLSSEIIGYDNDFTIIEYFVIGIIGSALAYFLLGFLKIPRSGLLSQIIVSILGALILLTIIRKVSSIKEN